MIMKKTPILLMAMVTLILAWCGGATPEQVSKDTAFAQCLTDAGFKMYGANRCGHCKEQKEMFWVKAFDAVKYVECTKEKLQCEMASVTAYPTWIGPGYKKSGVHTFAQLEKVSGCAYEPQQQETGTNLSGTENK